MSVRSRHARAQSWISIGLILGIVVCGLILVRQLRLRIDLTEDREFTLSPATVDLLEALDDRLQVKLYFNRDIEGAEFLLPGRIAIQDLLDEMQSVAGDRLSIETFDPSEDAAALKETEFLGIQPQRLEGVSATSISVQALYQGLHLRYENRDKVIPFVRADEFEYGFAVALSDLLRETRPRIGIFSREPPGMPDLPEFRDVPVPGRVFSSFRSIIEQRVDVEDVELTAEALQELDGLILLKPEEMSTSEVFELDQYLAGGGRVAIFYDHEDYRARIGSMVRDPIHTGLEAWLHGLGIHVKEQYVFEFEPNTGGVPVTMRLNTPTGPQESQQFVRYGLFVGVAGEGAFDREHVLTARQEQLFLFWAHPILVDTNTLPQGIEVRPLMRSSDRARMVKVDIPAAWAMGAIEEARRQALGSGPPRRFDLAVLFEGRFPSQFTPETLPDSVREAGGRELVSAAEPGVLFICGDSDSLENRFVNDFTPDFAQNLADWLALDESLVQLRTRGKTERFLRRFGQEWMDEHGAEAGSLTQEEQEEVRTQASRHETKMRNVFGWANVLGPPIVILFLGLAHWLFHRARAKRRYIPFSSQS